MSFSLNIIMFISYSFTAIVHSIPFHGNPNVIIVLCTHIENLDIYECQRKHEKVQKYIVSPLLVTIYYIA
jgi:hypothetical protein